MTAIAPPCPAAAPAPSTAPGDAEDAHGRPPAVLQDRVLSMDVTRVSVCARMRLAALVADGATVAVQRLSWQRLATLAPPPPPPPPGAGVATTTAFGAVTALAWAPASAALALGSDAGRVRVVPLDAVAAGVGAPTPADITLPHPVTALEWIDPRVQHVSAHDDRDAVAGHGPTSSLASSLSSSPSFRASLAYPSSSSSSLSATHAAATSDAVGVTNANNIGTANAGIIAVGDDHGRVTLLSFNLAFILATVQILPPGTPITRLSFPEHAIAFCVAAGFQHTAHPSEADGIVNLSETTAPAATTVPPTLVLSYFPLTPLSDALPELLRTGREVVAMSALLEDIRRASLSCREAWVRDAMGMLRERIYDPLKQLIHNFAEEPERGPWGLLQDAFCGGAISGALEQFLGSELGENGAKHAHRVLAAAAQEVRKALQVALPQAQRMVFRASEFRGLARVGPSFRSIGVTVASIDRVCVASETVLELLSSLAMEVDDVERLLVAFLKWIEIAAARASGTEQRDTARRTVDYAAATDDNALVAEFFDAVFAGEFEEPDQGPAFGNLVISTYTQFADVAMVELTNACRTMFTLPTTTLTERLATSAISMVRLPLRDSQVNSTPSILAISENVDVVCMSATDYVLAARCDVGPVEGVWKAGLFQTNVNGASICAVAHGAGDNLLLLARGRSHRGKSSFSLRNIPIADLKFQVDSVGNALSQPCSLHCNRTSCRDALEFCNAPTDAWCSLLIEGKRALACVLFGARRLVLFDLLSGLETTNGLICNP
jgi:Anaphase-promoting complex, cyclosome, subunit 4/Anaphase-promoting complex subunit 4 WD40 domain